jgi:acetyl-CoA C-acetyltransferase
MGRFGNKVSKVTESASCVLGRVEDSMLMEEAMASEALIVAGVRTPIGSLGGVLSAVPATELGATCIKAVLEKGKVPFDEVHEVIMGNVVGAGLGQNPARQASIKAGLPVSVGATTINKVCGSGLKAVMLATQSIRLGHSSVVVAGGMESIKKQTKCHRASVKVRNR